MIAVQEVPETEVFKYGIIEERKLSDGLFDITGVVEKPAVEAAPSNLAIQGRYIFTPLIFELLSHQSVGVGNEVQLTDAIAELIKIEPVYGQTVKGRVYDIGSKIGFLIANLEIALQRTDTAERLAEYLETLEQILKTEHKK
jgi:UTP--glucose-1-phosphate uridylyltransferase